MHTPLSDDDRAELDRLNAAVDAAIEARTRWLDAKMEQYAPVKVGETLYDLETGEMLGKVTDYYRYQAGQNKLYDTSLSIDLRYGRGENTSSQIRRRFGSKTDLERELQYKLQRLTA